MKSNRTFILKKKEKKIQILNEISELNEKEICINLEKMVITFTVNLYK